MPVVSGVSVSHDHKASFKAGQDAATAALLKTGAARAQALIFFATEQFDEKELVAGIQSVADGACTIGCSTAGIITAEGISHEGVAVAAVTGQEFSVIPAFADDIAVDSVQAGETLATRLLAGVTDDRRKGVVLMLANGFSKGVMTDTLMACYRSLGANYRYVGGGSGDNLGFKKSWQALNGVIYGDAIVAALIVTDSTQAVRLRHGWMPDSDSFVVTNSTGRIVKELDGRPALDVYFEHLGTDAKTFDFTKFYDFSMHHPFGLPLTNKEFVIRDPLSADHGDGSITFLSEVPQDSIVRIMKGNPAGFFAASRQAAETALTDLDAGKPSLVLVADCISRLILLKEQTSEEISSIRDAVGQDVPIIGFFSFGEVGYEKGGPPVYGNKTCGVYLLPV